MSVCMMHAGRYSKGFEQLRMQPSLLYSAISAPVSFLSFFETLFLGAGGDVYTA